MAAGLIFLRSGEELFHPSPVSALQCLLGAPPGSALLAPTLPHFILVTSSSPLSPGWSPSWQSAPADPLLEEATTEAELCWFRQAGWEARQGTMGCGMTTALLCSNSKISRELLSHSQPSSPLWYPLLLTPQPQTFSVAAQNVHFAYKAKKPWKSSVLLYMSTSFFLFCAACMWFITEMWFLMTWIHGLASSTKCWAVCKVSGGESKVISKLQFRKDIVYFNLYLTNAQGSKAG